LGFWFSGRYRCRPKKVNYGRQFVVCGHTVVCLGQVVGWNGQVVVAVGH
jgi:hypothetical protein